MLTRMFTGLIEATGQVRHTPVDGDGRLSVETPLGAELEAGDSIAVNGVCLTVAARDATGFEAAVSPETRRVTTLGTLEAGARINLERPLRVDGRLGGHFVLGHVDGIGRIRALEADGDCYWLVVDVPKHLAPYLIPKGSIAIDGISLTIAALDDARVRVQIIPYTWTQTSLSIAREHDAVNVEADVIGKYVARLLGDRISIS